MARMSIATGAACAVIFAAVIAVLLVLPGGRPGVFTALGYFALGLFCFAGCAAAFSGFRYLRSARPSYSVELRATGLAVVEAKRTRTYAWAEFAGHTETATAFVLTLKGTMAQLEVKKRDFTAMEAGHLRALLAQKLQQAVR